MYGLERLTGLWDTLLREIDKNGFGCEMMSDAMKVFPAPLIEEKLELAKKRRKDAAAKLPEPKPTPPPVTTYPGGRRHYTEEVEEKQEEQT